MGVVGWSIGNGWCTLLIPVMFANIQEVSPSEHVSLRSCHGTDYGHSIERHVCLWHREHYRHHRRLGLLPGDCEPDAGGYVPPAFPVRSRAHPPFWPAEIDFLFFSESPFVWNCEKEYERHKHELHAASYSHEKSGAQLKEIESTSA